jgi:hypothetical protein
MQIGGARRVGLKNSRDCDDRILEHKNGVNSAAGAAQTYRIPGVQIGLSRWRT